MLRRFCAIPLILCFLALGSGVLGWVHAKTHELEDRLAAAEGSACTGGGHHHHGSPPAPAPNDPAPVHDETNCHLHAMIRAPIASAAPVQLLIEAGIFVEFVTLLRSPLVGQLALIRIDCRGPPLL